MATIEQEVKKSLGGADVSEEIISRIVHEVMGKMEVMTEKKAAEVDRIKLIRGNQVVFVPFETGNPRDRVTFKEILAPEDGCNMATGFIKIEKSSFDWYLGYEELDYIVEGTLEITYNGKTHTGYAGDVMFIPKETQVTFGSPNHCKFFFAAYPSNWEDLCESEK